MAHAIDQSSGHAYSAIEKNGAVVSSISVSTLECDCAVSLALLEYSVAAKDSAALKVAQSLWPAIHAAKIETLSQLCSALRLCVALDMGKARFDGVDSDAEVKQLMDLLQSRFSLGSVYGEYSSDARGIDKVDVCHIGHCIEAIGLGMDWLGEKNLATAQLEGALLAVLELGWDSESGGLFCKRKTTKKLMEDSEWDRKLSSVHAQALSAAGQAYLSTGNIAFAGWFYQIRQWAFRHFPVPASFPGAGEWYVTLSREGVPVSPIISSSTSGFYHVPKFLLHGLATFKRLQLQRQDGQAPLDTPGLIFEGPVFKMGGLLKKTWVPRFAAVKDVDDIGMVIEWREKQDTDSIQHWISFPLIEKAHFREDLGVELGEIGRFKMSLETRWRSYDFAVESVEQYMEWQEVFHGKQ